MPLDPMLTNGIRFAEPEPYGAAAARTMSLKQMHQQQQAAAQAGELNTMKLDEAKRGVAQTRKLSDLLASGANDAGVVSGLNAAGYGIAAREYQAQAQAQQLAAQKQKLAEAGEMSKAAANLLKNVELAPVEQRQAILTQARARWAGLYPQHADAIPDTYTPEGIAAAMAEGRDADKAIAQAQEALKNAETERNNKAQTATSERGQDLTYGATVRGQDTTAATAAAGQKVTRDGQLLAATVAREGHGVQRRGQDIGATTAREGHAVTREGKPPSAAENRALNFYVRASDATEALDKMEKEMSEKGFFGQVGYNLLPNAAQSETNQAYRQAQRSFTEARLRKDSGAAIPPNEYEQDAKTYFVQPGDSKTVIEQKRQGRETILRGLKLESGRAVKAIGEEPGDRQPTQPPAQEPAKPIAAADSRFNKFAVGPDGHRIGSPDGGVSWFDPQTGKRVKD